MSVRFDASGDGLSRTTNLFNVQAAWTVFGRSYVVADTGANYQNIFAFSDGSTRYLGLYFEASTSNVMTLEGFMGNAVAIGSNFASRPSTGGWFEWAITCNGSNTLTAYWDSVGGNTWKTVTADPSGGDFTAPVVFGMSGGDFFNGRLTDLRIWTGAALSSSELQTERGVSTPARTSNLDSYYQLLTHTGLSDGGPNGRAALTVDGTLSTEADHPIFSSGTTITPGLGSVPLTGRAPSMNFSIGMPDVP